MQDKLSQAITKRFLSALDYIVREGGFDSVEQFCYLYMYDPQKVASVRKSPKNELEMYLLTILVEDYYINARWLLTGQGHMTDPNTLEIPDLVYNCVSMN